MSNPFSPRPPRSRFLQVAEYTSVAASAVGVVVSAISQQVVYAAAPLSLSLCLNVLNRRSFEQRTRQQLNSQIALLERRILELPVPDQTDLIERVAHLQEQINAIEQHQTDYTTQQAEVRSQLSQLHEQLTAVQQGQPGITTNLAELQTQFSQLSAQLISFRQHQLDAATSQTELEAQLSQLREVFAIQATQTAQNLTNATEQIVQQVLQLNAQLTTLQQRHTDETTDQAEVRSQLSHLHQQLTALQEHQPEVARHQVEVQTQFSQLTAQLTALQEQQNHATSQTELEALQQLFFELAEQVAQLQQRLAAIEVLEIESPPILRNPEVANLTPDLEIETESQASDGFEEGAAIELEELSLNLGIDFGTSFTKVCFRDMVNNQSEIVTFTDEVTHLEEALLPTKIGILSDGTLITGLTASEWQRYDDQVQTTVEFVKMRLAAFDLPQYAGSWQLAHLPQVSQAEAVENLCAYYLSRVIIRAQAWIRRNKPELIVNQKIDWSANVGVPVEYYDSKAIERFRKTLSLAWLLSNEPQTEPITLENLQDCLKPLRAKLQHPASNCHAIPEISAEVWSLINSREVDAGFYVLFDVGDGTLDGSAFRYWNDDGEKKVDFFAGKVNPLGVTAFAQQLAKELGMAETEVKETICANSPTCPQQFQTSTARKNIQLLVAKVVRDGSLRYGEHGFSLMQPGFKTTLAILIGGGGGQTAFYQQAITSTYQDFQHKNAGIPEYDVRSLPLPKDLETNGISDREFHRFAVAYGLSIPDGEQPQIRLPSQMEQIKPALSKEEDPLSKPPKYGEMQGSW
ncbi:MAG: hypothetical protein MUC48_10555 [Leptolyngbya sp. Prado105]|nr:hypothetical protein [Leptolyngbya sp. Prado105]